MCQEDLSRRQLWEPSAVGAVLRRVCGLEGQTVPVKVKSWY